jgi:hypothetical protein
MTESLPTFCKAVMSGFSLPDGNGVTNPFRFDRVRFAVQQFG